MEKVRHFHASDLRALAQLAADATIGVADLAEAVHAGILDGGTVAPGQARTRGISGFVYKAVRGTARLAGNATGAVLAPLLPASGTEASSPEREAVLAALNGVLGDTLAARGNPLALSMQLRQGGQALEMTAAGLREHFPAPGRKILVLAHGLCMNDLQWRRQGHDHGAALARDLGYTPVYLRYNSGLHVSINGRMLAGLLDALVRHWPHPVEALAMVCHSMGGLVARSAHYYAMAAAHAWPQSLRKLVFLGTPHHGAPLERIGNWVDVLLHATPYASPFARLGKIRSAGITDLRHGNLLDSDWEGHDRFARLPDRRQAVPLPEGTDCYAIAGTLAGKSDGLGGRAFGDGLVPVDSALGRHRQASRRLGFAPGRQWIAGGLGHLDLLSRAEVYERIRGWLEED